MPINKVIFQSSFKMLQDKVLDMNSTATECKFRVVDCAAITQDGILRIQEFPDFQGIQYSTVSYVWRASRAAPSTGNDAFSIKGAEDGDPISFDVLRHACLASLQHDAEYLWIDRLCILQTSRADKQWQIARMAGIYQACAACFVLPGGASRLAGIGDETPWIHRAWTLQEAMMPARVLVLFAWPWGSGAWRVVAPCTVREVVPRASAVAPLQELLQGAAAGFRDGAFSAPGYVAATTYPAFFGSSRAAQGQILGLLGAMTVREEDARAQAVWRSSLTRSSAHPVDMVFSIMGLFGITLDTRAFRRGDRVGATIALARAILARGGKAHWLGVSFYLPPCRSLSTFPIFPQTSADGKAVVPSSTGPQEVAHVMDGYFSAGWWVKGVPAGTMDGDGYLTISVKAARVVLIGKNAEYREWEDNMVAPADPMSFSMVAMDGRVWETADEGVRGAAPGGAQARAFAVLLGTQERYELPSLPRWHSGCSVRLVLVEEHATDQFNVSSFFKLGDVLKPAVGAWNFQTLSIGGPEVPHKSP